MNFIIVLGNKLFPNRVKPVFKDFFQSIKYVSSNNGIDKDFLQKSVLNEKICLGNYLK